MIWPTRLEDNYCVLELAISLLLDYCAWICDASFRMWPRQRNQILGQQISQYRSTDGRGTLSLMGKQSNIWGLCHDTASYCHLPACEIDLSHPRVLQGQQWKIPCFQMLSSMRLRIWPINTDLETFSLIHFLLKKCNFLCLREGGKG